MKINHPSWKCVTLAVATCLIMSGVASAGPINTVDVIATEAQFLHVTLLVGCRLEAADVAAPLNGDPNTVDVVAIQRYVLGMTGTGRTGVAIPSVALCPNPVAADIYGNTSP